MDVDFSDLNTSYSLIGSIFHQVSIDIVKWLVFQGYTFKGCNKAQDSRNRANLLKLVKLLAYYNEDVEDILSILVRDSKFCIVVDETRDESKKEQMEIILQFVDKEALEKANCEVLLHCCLNMDDFRGRYKGYDGASSMCGEWNIYFKKEVILICQNFSYLTCKIKLVASSSNQHDQLRDIETSHIAKLIDSGELEISKGKNQISFLNSSVRMFSFVCVVLQDIIKSVNLTQRSEVDGIHGAMTSIEFVSIFHFTIEMLGVNNDLCQALQYKSQYIQNAMQLVEHGWDPLFEEVKLFCKDHEIEVPNLNALYKVGRGQSRIQRDNLTIKHHYWLDIFTVELLVLSFALDPRDNYKAFWVEDICKLMNDFYPDDFIEQEKLHMKIQLEHFQLDAHQSTELQKAFTVANLGQVLAKTNKSSIYPLPDRIIHLVLTLLISIATTKRAFLAMKIAKTRLRKRMEDDFLLTYLVAYIEKEIAREFSTNSIIDGFKLTKKRKVQFRIPNIEK
ncbi:hypothetical protein V6Z11_A13G124400 [Gossypium hirsutum]